jgi:hypothetical protein
MTPMIARIAAALVGLAFASSASLSDEPANLVPKTDEEKALAAWRKVYHLDPDQVVKRVAPPFIAERMAGAELRAPFLKQNRERRGFPLTMIYYMRGDTIDNTSMTFGGAPDPTKGRQLVHLIEGIAGIPGQDVEGPKALLETEIPGDFLVRRDIPIEDIVEALQTILWLECGLKINLKLRDIERDVVVARGKFRFKPRVAGRDSIDIYGATLNENGGGSGKFAEFLDWTGNFMEPKRRIVNEVDEAPKGDISWSLNARDSFTEVERLADHEAAAVLKHLEEQTGLTFTPAKRKVRTLFVEAGK